MYGQAGTQSGGALRGSAEVQEKPQTISQINHRTIEQLRGALNAIEMLLSKLRGPQPENTAQSPEPVPSVMTDAKTLSLLAGQIQYSVNELHQIIGE